MTSQTTEIDQDAEMALAYPFIYEEIDSKSLHFTINQLQSRMRISEPNRLDVDYTRTMMGFLLLNRHPRRIAMIGLGGGSLAKFCRHHLPHASFTAVEINPHIIALRKEFHVPEDSDHFRVIESDGADFVREAHNSIDVLLVDGFDHQGQPAQLCSQKFYEDCKSALAPNGVLVVNFHEHHPLYELFVARLDSTFQGNIAEISANDEGNVIVFASNDLKISPVGLRASIGTIQSDWPAWMAQNA